MTIKLQNLDYHVIDSCNLACDFCAHYSNFKGVSGIVPIETIEDEWSRWSKKVTPTKFNILGGEPLIRTDIADVIRLASRIWNQSTIVLYTNGLLLKNHPELKSALSGCGIELGMHLSYKENYDNLNKVKTFFHGWHVNVNPVSTDTGWTPFYQFDEQGKPIPFNDNNQRQSWSNCIAAQCKCFTLRDYKLYKCPQIAYADRANVLHWFEDYDPCTPESDILSWVNREDESCCSKCPANPQTIPHNETTQKIRLPVLI